MKIRQGFVSNSSSSSFCIRGDSYPNVFEIAIEMIPEREWDRDQELIDKIERKKSEGMSPDTNICFNSCNYDTYIVKKNDYYLIQTCSNHSFFDILRGVSNMPVSMIEELGLSKSNWREDLENAVEKMGYFWFAEYDLIGMPDLDYNNQFCENHALDRITLKDSGKKVCPACYLVEMRELDIESNKIKSRLEILDI
jgi:hypothetical protein